MAWDTHFFVVVLPRIIEPVEPESQVPRLGQSLGRSVTRSLLLAAVAVVLHNLLGLSGGYWCSRLLGLDRKQSRTIAIEVGMQNSGLGVALALQFFSATAALPGALSSVWHNITGSVLAAKWGKR